MYSYKYLIAILATQLVSATTPVTEFIRASRGRGAHLAEIVGKAKSGEDAARAIAPPASPTATAADAAAKLLKDANALVAAVTVYQGLVPDLPAGTGKPEVEAHLQARSDALQAVNNALDDVNALDLKKEREAVEKAKKHLAENTTAIADATASESAAGEDFAAKNGFTDTKNKLKQKAKDLTKALDKAVEDLRVAHPAAYSVQLEADIAKVREAASNELDTCGASLVKMTEEKDAALTAKKTAEEALAAAQAEPKDNVPSDNALEALKKLDEKAIKALSSDDKKKHKDALDTYIKEQTAIKDNKDSTKEQKAEAEQNIKDAKAQLKRLGGGLPVYVWVIIAVVAVVAIGAGVYFYMRK